MFGSRFTGGFRELGHATKPLASFPRHMIWFYAKVRVYKCIFKKEKKIASDSSSSVGT